MKSSREIPNYAKPECNEFNFEEAVTYFNNAIRLQPSIQRNYEFLGKIYYHVQQYEKAIDYFTSAIQLNPTSSVNYFYRGCCYYKLGNFNGAYSEITIAIKHSPQVGFYYYNLALIYIAKNQTALAASCFKQAIACDYNTHNAYANYANMLLQLGNYDSAIYHYLLAMLDNPKEYKTYHSLAYAYFRQGKLNDAIYHYDLVINKMNYSASLRGRALVHLCKKSYQAALTDLKTAIKKSKHPYTYFLLAITQLKLSDNTAAIKNLQQAILSSNKKYTLEKPIETYAYILLNRLTAEQLPTYLLNDLENKLKETQDINYEHIECLVMLAVGAHATNKIQSASEYSIQLLAHGHPKHIPYYFREEWVNVITSDNVCRSKTISSIMKLDTAKEDWLTCIKQIDNTDLRHRALWQALLPNTMLGCMMHIKRGFFRPRLAHGQLLKVLELLNAEQPQHVDTTFISSLAALKSSQPARYERFIYEILDLDKKRFAALFQLFDKYNILQTDIIVNQDANLQLNGALQSFNTL